jgi:hypothetical protein
MEYSWGTSTWPLGPGFATLMGEEPQRLAREATYG